MIFLNKNIKNERENNVIMPFAYTYYTKKKKIAAMNEE
jgi:hypothetical protein